MDKKILLKTYKNFNFIDFATPIIDLICPIGNSPNQKYDNEYFLTCIIDFLKSGFCWTRYNGTPEFPIKGKYLNQIHNKYVNNNVYEEIEKQLKNKYLKHNREPKLKIQIIDSSFIANKRGSIKENNHLLTKEEKLMNKSIKKNKENKETPVDKKLKKENKEIPTDKKLKKENKETPTDKKLKR
jgi:hypothetical protein